MGDEASERLAGAGAALARRDWAGAQALFEQVLDEAGEDADALEGLAVTRWWQDDVDAAIRLRERAYLLRRNRGQTIEAARDAGLLAWDYGAMRGVTAVASGWLERARRLTAELPPSAEQAWLPLVEASFHLDTDAVAVLRLSREAAAQAGPHGALDIEMTARTLQGLALVSLGRVEEGTRLLDEGTAAATAGELHDPIAIGSCCCNMIIACERVRDFDRAGQWCEQLAAFCERTGHRPLLALCRAHHGTVLMQRGDWAGADEDLTWAAGELARLRPPLARYARARLAQLRLRQGRVREAREVARGAAGHVLASLVDAELAFDADDPATALAHAERHLSALGGDPPIESAAGLELLVRARLALGDGEGARDAHDQLAAIARAAGTPALLAAAHAAEARIAVADRDEAAARRALAEAIDLYERGLVPLEAAEARLALAHVLAADGRPASAAEQAAAARAAFAALGAAPAERRAARMLTRVGGRGATRSGAQLTPRETEVLALVADGLPNRAIAERLVVSEHTVHRHMANIYARLGVSSRAAAVARAAERGLELRA